MHPPRPERSGEPGPRGSQDSVEAPALRASPYGRGGWKLGLSAVIEWVDDGVPFPGEAFRSWVLDFYRHDRLARGELELRGRRVELSNVRIPLLSIAGEDDVICPLPQAEATMNLVGSRDKAFLALAAGHVGLMAGPVAKGKFWPHLVDWLGQRSA